MAKISKRLKDLNQKIDNSKEYSLEEAISTVKDLASAKFDETVEIVDVGLVMFAVVEFQRFLADGRGKGVHFIIKLGQNELAHWTSPRESVIDRISLHTGRVSSKIALRGWRPDRTRSITASRNALCH